MKAWKHDELMYDLDRPGYVYVLSNSAMPGLIKIGRSIHGGRSRAKNLYQTGVPTPFKLEFEMLVDDAVLLERAVHERLDKHRVNDRREFFKTDVADAIVACLGAYAECLDHRVDYAELGAAIDAASEFADSVQEHPIIVANSFRFLSEFSVRSALSKYHDWMRERCLQARAAK